MGRGQTLVGPRRGRSRLGTQLATLATDCRPSARSVAVASTQSLSHSAHPVSTADKHTQGGQKSRNKHPAITCHNMNTRDNAWPIISVRNATKPDLMKLTR